MDTNAPDLHRRLTEVIALVEPAPLSNAISEVFNRLIGLLDYTDLLEACLSSDQTLLKSHLLFKVIQERAVNLIAFIETKAKRVEGALPDHQALFESTIFAIHHELKRVQILTAARQKQSVEQLRTEFTRAQGLLLNCFQQSTISLALAFDPSISGAHLFADFKLKLDQSVMLHEALTILIEQVSRTETERNLDSYFALIEGLKMFGQGYIQYLMYRDWAEFERLSETIINVRAECELWPQLTQFGRYLETLLGHVKMRSVLQNYQLQRPKVTV